MSARMACCRVVASTNCVRVSRIIARNKGILSISCSVLPSVSPCVLERSRPRQKAARFAFVFVRTIVECFPC